MTKKYYDFFFSSGGNFIHYYMGYASVIQQYLKNYYPNQRLNIGGVSAGSLASSFLAFDIDINKVYPEFNKKLTKNLTTKSYFNVINNFTDASYEHFENKKLVHNLHLYVTKINYNTSAYYTNNIKLTSEYFIGTNDLNKMKDYIGSSCYLPLFGTKLCYPINSSYYLDGFLTFNPNDHNINKIICYSKYIKNSNIVDKYPSSNYEQNLELYNIGKKYAKIDLKTNNMLYLNKN